MSDVPIVVYDAKCGSCSQLARKIQFSSRGRLEIGALSDPKVTALLSQHYPKGWDHSFYLVSQEFARKGARLIPGLLRAVGFRKFMLLAAEYVTLARTMQQCRRRALGEAQRGADVTGESVPLPLLTPQDPRRRSFLKAAALSPLVIPAARLPRIADPLQENSAVFLVNVAEVSPNGSGFSVRAWECQECLVRDGQQKLAQAIGDRPAAQVLSENRVTLLDRPVPIPAPAGFATPSLRIDRVEREVEAKDASGTTFRGSMTSDSVLFEQGRYHLSLNMGRGRVSDGTDATESVSMAGMVGHDVALPVVDFVVSHGKGEDNPSRFLSAYQAGVQELGRMHARANREPLSTLYSEIGNGLATIASTIGTVGRAGAPAQNQLVLTQTVDMLRFVTLPPGVQPGPRRGDGISIMSCSCSCGCCCGCCSACGCGCSLGFCFPPGICTCCCGTNCGCGCGCGCCCGWGC